MKKIIVFFVIILIIVTSMSMIYFNYKVTYNNAKKENEQFEYYYEKEIYGADLVSVINMAIDNNVKYNVLRDNKGKYVENNENSIKIDINIIDNNTIYDMETIYNAGMDNFIKHYNTIKFKCVDMDHHKSTHKVKYLLFEQITQ